MPIVTRRRLTISSALAMLALPLSRLRPDAALAAPIQATNGSPLGMTPPDVSAAAIYAYDLDSGSVLYTKNADAHRPVASVTKIVTALVTYKHATRDEAVDIDDSDLIDPESEYTRMGLQSGDRLLVLDLVYGLLLPSGGDAANALARFVGTKISGESDPDVARGKFVEEMNAYVASLGLADTYFVDPAGENDRGFSSAHDIAVLGGELMAVPDLAFIVAQQTADVTSQKGVVYSLKNTNDLLDDNLGVVGIKTGSTSAAGANVLLARQVNGGESIVVVAVLGATLEYDADGIIVQDTRYDDAKAIFADMDERFTWTSLADASDVFPTLSEEMSVWDVTFQDPPVLPIPTDGGDASYQLVIGAPVGAGEQAGVVEIYSGRTLLGSVPVYQAG